MLGLARGLREQSWAVDFVTMHGAGPLRNQVPRDVRLIDLAAARVPSRIIRLAAYLRRERPRFLISAGEGVNLVALLARRLAAVPTRTVVTVRNSPAQLPLSRHGWIRRRMHHLSPALYRLADGVVAVSEGVADELSSVMRLPRAGIDVIYNPVVTPELATLATQPVEHPWFQPGAPPVILGMGRLHPQKDFATLLRAFRILCQQRRDARLVILGEGPERAKLEAMARDFAVGDLVDLPGYVMNPFPYLAHASVFVLCSQFEGLPGALIQAMACGCPVVSTDCPSGPREILENGRYGPLVSVGDAEALAEAVLQVLKSPTPSEGLRQKANAFLFERSVGQYQALFARILAPKRHRKLRRR
jgi:glycosyltransferase involved in cell wall biosynthesis